MKALLLADENTSHHFVRACLRLRPELPIAHLADWQAGAHLSAKDMALLMTLREHRLVLVSFDRASLPMFAGDLTRQGLGHAGIILFRRTVPMGAFGHQARLLVEFWKRGQQFDWDDRIEYLPSASTTHGS